MISCFADTFYFLAMLNPNDEAHSRALAIAATSRRPLLTTKWVLTEVADALASSSNRGVFSFFLNTFRSDPRATIAPDSDDLFDRGVLLYSQRHDKNWPLTDCISFVLMQEMGITEALTADHHFEQAGFRILMG
jgi:uncharacterized protein